MALHSNQQERQGKAQGQLLFPEILTARVQGDAQGLLQGCLPCWHRTRALPWAHLIFGVGFARCKLDIVEMDLDQHLTK